jgi:type IV pilus assembly protein PilM
VDAFALQNIFEVTYDTNEDNIALIDIGASKTSLNILKGKTSVFMRDVSLGCGQINQKIVSIADCTLEEAEELKFGNETDKISQEDLSDIISSVVADWCTEIRRALDFFYSTYPDEQIKKIILSGGGRAIAEFRQLLAVETSADVQTINPFESFHVNEDRFEPAFIERIAPQASICMGLAIRRVSDK